MMIIDIICITALTIGAIGVAIVEHQENKKEKEKEKIKKKESK